MEKGNVLLFVPNIIGYVRVLLIVLAFAVYSQHSWFILLYGASVVLDGLDGYAARKLNQCSDFGAWFDVVVDLFGRGLLWCSLHQYGYVVIFVEWLTFVTTHCRGPKWKIPEDSFPWLVTRVMANGFKTAWGVVAIGGLHILPLWMYAYHFGFLSSVLAIPYWSQLTVYAALVLGRFLCLYVEMFYICNHVKVLLRSDSNWEES